eukprot:TRINITY_DN13113_c0_g1_i1.p1 TRINITY_DN13113_c0_g1~~TRINITY_DN13113_c0_g1_i1.p1  ORF type:complete len:557 (+),score=182.94 TRINITY_DN13113_c0_g1_i1:408-2078(+)
MKNIFSVLFIVFFLFLVTGTESIEDSEECNNALHALHFFVDFLLDKNLAKTPIYSPTSVDSVPLLEGYFERENVENKLLAEYVTSTVDGLLVAQAVGNHATLGEMSVAMTEFSKYIKSIENNVNATNTSEFWDEWATIWFNLAKRTAGAPQYAYDRAMNYATIAQHPFPITETALGIFNQSYVWMGNYFDEVYPGAWQQVSIPFNQLGFTSLNGYLIQHNVDSSKPFIIATAGGFDLPTPGMMSQQQMEAVIKAGYGVLMYEGPGQGIASRYDNSVFTNEWHLVVDAVADYVVNNPNITNGDNIISASWSFGGYLMAEGCALVTNPAIKGCIIDPATPNFAFSMNYAGFSWAITPYTGSKEQIATVSKLCGDFCINYLPYYSNVTAVSNQGTWNPDPFLTALIDENCSSGRSYLLKLFTEFFGEYPLIIPDLSYTLFKMLPFSSYSYSSLKELVDIIDNDPQTFSQLYIDSLYIFQNYQTDYNTISKTKPAILATGGTEDFIYQSTCTTSYFKALQSNNNKSMFHMFDSAGGDAQHDQMGSQLSSLPYWFKFLEQF